MQRDFFDQLKSGVEVKFHVNFFKKMTKIRN